MEEFIMGRWVPPEGVEMPENVYVSTNGNTYNYRKTAFAQQLIPLAEAEKKGLVPSKDFKTYMQREYKKKSKA